MKLQSISACLVVCLAVSINAMEEREKGSITPVWAEIIQPHSAAGVGVLESHINPSVTSSPYSSFSSPILSPGEPSEDFLKEHDQTPEMQAKKLSLELGLYLDKYTEDDTYQDIPVKDRKAFMDNELMWAKNPKCYYNRCKIYDIPSAKMRYDLMQEHYRQKRNGRIGMVALGTTAFAALVGAGYFGKAYLDTKLELSESDALLDKTIGLTEKAVEAGSSLLYQVKILTEANNVLKASLASILG